MFDLKRVFGFLLAAPMTIVGLAYVSLISVLGWCKYVGRHGDGVVWQISNESPELFKRINSHVNCQCMGNVIVVKYDIETTRGQAALRHNQEHVQQHMALGPLQPILYLFSCIGLMVCRNAHPYYDNPFEIDARRATGQVVDVVGAIKKAIAQGRFRQRTNV